MQVAKKFGEEIKSNKLLDLSVSILYELAAPSTKDAIVQEVLAGEIAPNLQVIKDEKSALSDDIALENIDSKDMPNSFGREAKRKKNQETIADILGWHVSKVKKYSALSQICKEAWDIIVPTFEDTINPSADEDGTEKVPNGTIFAEGLLRNVLDLTSEQQLELIKDRANDPKGLTMKSLTLKIESMFFRRPMRLMVFSRELKTISSEQDKSS